MERIMDSREFFDSKQEMIAFTAQMKMLGVKYVVISFQGGGDSGEIYSVDYYSMNGEPMEAPKDMVSWTKQTYGDQEKTQSDISIDKVIEDIGYRVLDATGMDWYNNDGGQGEVNVSFDGELPRIDVDMAINITQTEDHTFEYDPIDDDAHFYPQEEK